MQKKIMDAKNENYTFWRRNMGRFFFSMVMIAAMLLAGCGKVTSENYDKIKTGMAYEEVVKILGDADKCESGFGAKNCQWGSDAKNIKINFLADKVIVYSKEGF